MIDGQRNELGLRGLQVRLEISYPERGISMVLVVGGHDGSGLSDHGPTERALKETRQSGEVITVDGSK